MTTIEIKIDNRGQMAGTLGWLKKQLENSTILIREQKNGDNLPAAYIKLADSREQALAYVCKANEDPGYHFGLRNEGDSIGSMYPISYDRETSGVFDYLTPAAEKKMQEIINEAVSALKEFLQKN